MSDLSASCSSALRKAQSRISPYLQVSIEQPLGGFWLNASCELDAPWTVLFGPSGAGKSSLLRVLGGLHRPGRESKRARVVFRGRTLVDIERGIWVPPGERRIGFVVQRAALFPHMSVAANIGFGLHRLSVGTRQDTVHEMLRLFAIEPLATRKPAALSGGERQRVALARALAPQPEMLLLDEPFTGLDAPLKESILDNLMKWLTERDIPALYVSHDVTEAFLTNADVIVLRNGKIEGQGPAGMVLAQERERLLRNLG